MAHQRHLKWCIKNEEGLYWNNSFGWGDVAGMTIFSQTEAECLTLPIGGRWHKVELEVKGFGDIQETINQKAAANLNLTNEERSQRAEMAIAAYPGGDPEDLSATIVDLITDLMHLAHQNDIEPDYVARQSGDHYIAEVEGAVR